MKKIIFIFCCFLFVISTIFSDDLFTTVENPWGGYPFIVNTATGQVTMLDYSNKNQLLIGIIEENNKTAGKYLACKSQNTKNYKNVFIINTATGEVYTFNTQKGSLKKYKKNTTIKEYEIGTYMPINNQSGAGIIILNTITGDCFWTIGNEWDSYPYK